MTDQPVRVVFDASKPYARCAFSAMVPTGIAEGPPIFRHHVIKCLAPTDGRTVRLPVGELDAVVDVDVCPVHLRELWKLVGEPRGEAPWFPQVQGTPPNWDE